MQSYKCSFTLIPMWCKDIIGALIFKYARWLGSPSVFRWVCVVHLLVICVVCGCCFFVFCCCLSSFCVFCPMLWALSLDSPFLIVLLVFSNVNSTKLTFFWIHIPDMMLAFYVGNLLHISYRWHHLETFLLYRQGTLLKMREGWRRNSGTETTGPSGHYEILLELPKPEEL